MCVWWMESFFVLSLFLLVQLVWKIEKGRAIMLLLFSFVPMLYELAFTIHMDTYMINSYTILNYHRIESNHSLYIQRMCRAMHTK